MKFLSKVILILGVFFLSGCGAMHPGGGTGFFMHSNEAQTMKAQARNEQFRVRMEAEQVVVTEPFLINVYVLGNQDNLPISGAEVKVYAKLLKAASGDGEKVVVEGRRLETADPGKGNYPVELSLPVAGEYEVTGVVSVPSKVRSQRDLGVSTKLEIGGGDNTLLVIGGGVMLVVMGAVMAL